MRSEIHAALIIARKRIDETLLAPTWYLVLGIGMLVGYVVVSRFAMSIDSAGLNPGLTPAYSMLVPAIHGILGESTFDALFAEGPARLSLTVIVVPVFLYLSLSSAFRYSYDRRTGYVELVAYGPCTGFSYVLGEILKDTSFIILTLVTAGLFTLAICRLMNIAPGSSFMPHAISMIPAALAIAAAASLASSLFDNPVSSVFMFLAYLMLCVWLAVRASGQTGIPERSIFTMVMDAAAWLSPLSPLPEAGSAVSPASRTLSFLHRTLLAASALVLCSYIVRRKGVRS